MTQEEDGAGFDVADEEDEGAIDLDLHRQRRSGGKLHHHRGRGGRFGPRLVEGNMDWWKALQVVHARRSRSIQDGTHPVDFETLNRLLEKLCAIYLKADEERRIAIRAIFDDKQSLLKYLHSYIGRAAQRLGATKDKKWLRLGLAAASICDRRVDWRDLMICLGDLYVTAKEAGFRPGYSFTAVAKMSNPSRRYGESSTRDLLANFRKSAYLKSIQRKRKEV